MISGIGSIYSGAAGGVAEQQAAQKEWTTNDALAQWGARTALLKGQREAGDVRAQGTQTAELQRLAYANSGVDASYGTAAAVQADTAAKSELDAQVAKNNLAREAWGFKVAQQQAHDQYNARQAGAQNKAIGSYLTGASQLASGGTSLFGGG